MTDKTQWPTVKFGDVVELNKDRVADPAAEGIERYVGLEHLEPNNLRIRSWGLVEDGTTFTNYFRPGQVLFGKRRAYQRKVAVADSNGVCSGDIYVFEPKDPAVLLPDLLPFICQTDSFFEHAVGTSAGSLSPRTNWTQLARYEFALPPLEEQRRLSALLQASHMTLEAYYEVCRTSRNILRSLQKKYFLESPEGNQVKIGQVANVQNGTTPRRNRPEYWNGKIPWLPTGKVNDRFIVSADEFITEKALSECSLHIIPTGSTLIAMIGQGQTRGRAARLEFNACINQNFGAVIPRSDVDTWYLFYQVEASYEKLRAWSQGTNQHALNCSLIQDFPIWLPKKERQVEIVEELRSADRAIQLVECRRQNNEMLFASLREALMQSKV